MNVIFFFLSNRPSFRKDRLSTITFLEVTHVQNDRAETVPSLTGRIVVVPETTVRIVDVIHMGNIRRGLVVPEDLQSIRMTLNVRVHTESLEAPSLYGLCRLAARVESTLGRALVVHVVCAGTGSRPLDAVRFRCFGQCTRHQIGRLCAREKVVHVKDTG